MFDKDFNLSPEIKSMQFVDYTEIASLDSLTELLGSQSADKASLDNPKLIKKLQILLDRISETKSNAYIVQVANTPWCVVAENAEMIAAVQPHLNKVAALQKQIEPEKLGGDCISIHEYAGGIGVADGILSAHSRPLETLEESIHPSTGIHSIAYLDTEKDSKSMYFDLTAKHNIFSVYPATEAVLEGLIVIEEYQQSSTIENLYKCAWTRIPFDPKDPLSQRVISTAKDKFLKKNRPV